MMLGEEEKQCVDAISFLTSFLPLSSGVLFPVASFQETLDLSTRKEESGSRKVSFNNEESSRKVSVALSLIEESREETGKWKQEIRSYPEYSVP